MTDHLGRSGATTKTPTANDGGLWIDFGPARPVAAEGARIGLVDCPACGATLMIDPAGADTLMLHIIWHRELTSRGRNVS